MNERPIIVHSLEDAEAALAAAADLGEGHIGLACNVTDKAAVFAVVSNSVIGENTTIWLDTDAG